ncbi:MAG: GtrA family protein [Solobacterium sp.]|nr:GtrA family protein [Solobacterium sp.]
MLAKIKEKFFNRRFLTFGIIGVLNTLIAQVLYVVYLKGVPDYAASILADATAMAFSYVMNMRFTYHQKMSLKSAAAFPMSYLPGILISAVIVFLVVRVGHAPEIYAKLISVPLYVPLNFLCMNFIVKRFAGKGSNA